MRWHPPTGFVDHFILQGELSPPPQPHRLKVKLQVVCRVCSVYEMEQLSGSALGCCCSSAGPLLEFKGWGKKSSENKKQKKGRTQWMGSSIIFVILALLPNVCRTTWFHTISPFRVLEGSVVRRGSTVQAITEQFSNWAAFEFTSLQNKAAEIIRGGREAPICAPCCTKKQLATSAWWCCECRGDPQRVSGCLAGNFQIKLCAITQRIMQHRPQCHCDCVRRNCIKNCCKTDPFFYYYLLTSQDISRQSLKNVGRYLEQYCNINEHIKMTVSNIQKGRDTVQEGDRKSVRRASGRKKNPKKNRIWFCQVWLLMEPKPIKNCFGTVWLMTPGCS